MRFGFALVATVALLATGLATGMDARYLPSDVSAESSDLRTAVVTWAPGKLRPDAYRVYGILHGHQFLLDEVPGSAEPSSTVRLGYDAYAVSAVTGAEESSADQTRGECIEINLFSTPPRIGIKFDCPTDRVIIKGVAPPGSSGVNHGYVYLEALEYVGAIV